MVRVIAREMFDTQPTGWTINKTSSGSNGLYLGGFGSQVVEKEFDISDSLGPLTIEFDFLEIDSWDDESFFVLINGQQIDLGSFSWKLDETETRFEAPNGILVERAAALDVSGYGVSNYSWNTNDNLHKVKITIPNPGDELTLGFSSTLNQGTNDESYGIDNLVISERVGLKAEYFNVPTNVSSLSQIDFGATPIHVESVDKLRYSGSGSFYDSGPVDLFAARYSGTFTTNLAGPHTFYLSSDDGSALYINGQRVINNDGIHGKIEKQVTIDLAPGSHDIEVRYFERGGGATLDLDWRAPGASREQMIFTDLLEPVTGLTAQYFELPASVSRLSQIDFLADPVNVEIVEKVAFNVGSGAFYEGGATNNFAALLTGNFRVETTGNYTFHLTSDDGSALYINGEQVISNDGLHGALTKTASVNLGAGSHDIEIRYFERGGGAVLDLDWSGPGFARKEMVFTEAPVSPAPSFDYTTPEEKLRAMFPDMESIGVEGLADFISSSKQWNGGTITYSFPTIESPDYVGTDWEGRLFGFGAGQQAHSRKIMSDIDDLIAFDVVDLGDSLDAQTRFYNVVDGRNVFGGGLPGEGYRGDIWVYNQDPDAADHNTKWADWSLGQRNSGTVIHEVGHTLGLLHTSFLTYDEADPNIYENRSSHLEGFKAYSVMSYWTHAFVGLEAPTGLPGTMMLADVMALHAKYGPNMETRTGNDTYGFNSNLDHEAFNYDKNIANNDPLTAFTIWDAGGRDRIDMSDFNEGSFISLIEGTFSSTGGYDMNIAIAPGAIIEDGIGGHGDDQIIGNDTRNVLSGLPGADLLVGNGGHDVLYAGKGNDALSGGRGNDYLFGGLGNDKLDGGAGNDNLRGDAGSDTFVFKPGDGKDKIVNLSVSQDILDVEGAFTLTDTAGGALLSYGNGDTILLKGVEKAELLGSRALSSIESNMSLDNFIDFDSAV